MGWHGMGPPEITWQSNVLEDVEDWVSDDRGWIMGSRRYGRRGRQGRGGDREIDGDVTLSSCWRGERVARVACMPRDVGLAARRVAGHPTSQRLGRDRAARAARAAGAMQPERI
jgi:hypothetical protein